MADIKGSSTPPAETGGRLRILHLEDSESDRDLVRHKLQVAGIAAEIIPASERDEFEAALLQGGFDVILSDYRIPGYDGSVALESAQRFCRDVPFIFVSGTIGEERAIESIRRGATDYVLKDHLDRLPSAIRRALEEVAERRRRREAEVALRESEERFRQMAANIREVFWSMSADQEQVLYVSPAYEQIWGRSLGELCANPRSWREAVWPEERERVAAAVAELRQGKPYQLEYRIVRPDGSIRWVEDRGYPVRGQSGAVERLVGVAVDITQRKELESQLIQAQKVEALGQLAGGVAHDFNNVLTVITGFSRLLLDGESLPANLVDPITHIYTAGTRAANLTRQLLLFSRQQTPLRQPVDLNEIVENIAAMLVRLIGENIGLRLESAPGQVVIEADAGMIEQVLMNLALNARDAMPSGGTLVIGMKVVQVPPEQSARHRGARAGEFVCLEVRDTGCGIPPEHLNRIFEPFFTTKDPGRGTGLGLATVFGIVRQHEGWIEVDSTVGQGSAFRVFLPASKRVVPAVSGRSGRAQIGAKGSETLLLVEDEALVREFALAVLRGSGFRVLQAASGPEALEVWRWHRSRISLLFTDLVIPQYASGVALAEDLRRDKPSLKVVLASGYLTANVGSRFAPPEGMHFIHKPYKPNVLSQTIRDALDDAFGH